MENQFIRPLHSFSATMDGNRTVYRRGDLYVEKDRIAALGTDLTPPPNLSNVIDARNKVVLPGFVNCHAHLQQYFRGVYELIGEFFSVNLPLEGYRRPDDMEKLGLASCAEFIYGGCTTTMLLYTYPYEFADAAEKTGLRAILGADIEEVSLEKLMQGIYEYLPDKGMAAFKRAQELYNDWHGRADGKINVCLMFPTHHPENGPLSQVELEDLRHRVGATRELSKKYGLLFTQDGHTRGTVKFAHEVLGILGPDALLSHSTELTAEEIRICRETDTRIVHNPSAITSMRGRCPATELIDAGVTVMLGSDGVGPDRSYDMFRHMFQAMRYHRFHFRDPDVLPAGQVLAMVTIDAARALGLEKDLGSLEPGKKADVILIDMLKPHLYPPDMPVYRVAYFANGNDVDTVIINGEVLMEGRRVKTVDEAHVLALARKEATEAIERSELGGLLALPDGFWGVTKGLPDDGS